MSKTVVVEEEIMQWTPEEKKETSSRYGCEILIENGTVSQIKDPSFPNDAYIVWYIVNENSYMDLCRGTRVKIFDMYYDKFGPGAVKKIDWGYGRISPRMWGYRAPEKKKRK